MPKYARGVFAPKNPAKYIGAKAPIYRSGWELVFMTFCDSNKHIQYWASEALVIPYQHPFTGKRTNYIPDFFVVYQTANGKNIAEVVEIKPKKQSLIESKVASKKDRMVVAINHAKWLSAKAYCASKGYTFRVITEDDIFHNGRPPR
jgi:hypothetical protein